MADSDGVVTDQNLLDHEPHNSLPLNDIERVRSAAQTVTCRVFAGPVKT
jgi:hypothetical protein